MIKQNGFTLIETIIFIIITGILASTIMMSLNTSLHTVPSFLYNTVANQTAQQCVEWFIGQRQLNGYTAFSCPSTTTPSFCTSPTGYSISVDISCTTINSDSNYKNITVSVSGLGTAKLTTLVADY